MKCFCPVCKIGWYDELEKCHECGGPLVEPEVPSEVPAGKEASLPTPKAPQVENKATYDGSYNAAPVLPKVEKPKKSHKKKVVTPPQEVVPGEDKS